jgi:hypothetical protein
VSIDNTVDEDMFDRDARIISGRQNQALAAWLRLFYEGHTDHEFSANHLKKFIKKDSTTQHMSLDKYNMMYGHNDNNRFYQYFESQYNFCMAYKRKEIASLGFDAEEGRIFVDQIQGVRGCGHYLMDIKWSHAQLSYLMENAASLGVPMITVVSVENNRWAQLCHLDYEGGMFIYNVTAKRLGFKKDREGNYTKLLNI